LSNSLAIAAVTNTLQKMLTNTTSGVLASLPQEVVQSMNLSNMTVTTRPLDRARPLSTDDRNQLNLFLYQTLPDAAWRNMDLPRQVRSGETAMPPVALTLHYLLSAYPSNEDDSAAHVLLGQAMRIFHDHAILDRNDIRNALPQNDLFEQVEAVRITPLALSVEEISKLWTAFATNYRVSAAFEVSVVLIESLVPGKTPMPVLRRGQADRGASAEAGASLPSLDTLLLPSGQSSVALEDKLMLAGRNFDGFSAVRFTLANPRLAGSPPILLIPPDAQPGAEGITATLHAHPFPVDPANPPVWVAGFYSVAVLTNRTLDNQQQTWSSNELPLAVAPRITNVAPGNVLARDANGNVTITLTCAPAVVLAAFDPLTDTDHMRFGQQVILLLTPLNPSSARAARQLAPQPPPPPPPAPAQPPASLDTLTFVFPVQPSQVGDYWLRLRVDGVDLPVVDRTVTPPQFGQKVTIQ
jgi:Pvc16 N-terminal domain